jgi:flagellar protein FliJ
MAQSLKSRSQFGTTAVNNLFPNPIQRRDRNAVERLDRVRQLGIQNAHQRIEQMKLIVADFDRTARELEGWIQLEQNRSGVHDPAQFNYSAAATAMIQRRDALKRSRDMLKRSIDELVRQLASSRVTPA